MGLSIKPLVDLRVPLGTHPCNFRWLTMRLSLLDIVQARDRRIISLGTSQGAKIHIVDSDMSISGVWDNGRNLKR